MNVLKIATAGSVDDGKSTLIGRILYDTNSLTSDKLEAIEKNSKQKGFDYLDFSLATDGLVAEREQGITIDVAHIYFSSEKRSYIIADSPGHIEYTRNMVTGASTSQASIILVDARNGVIEQTYRHFFINHLLCLPELIIAVNKMDMVNYEASYFEAIKNDVLALAEKAGGKPPKLTFVPISALHGDNVVFSSEKMPWYTGQSVLDILEQIEASPVVNTISRFPIQGVVRPKTADYHDFRAYSGKVVSGQFNIGDEVVVLPNNQKSKIKNIHFFKDEFDVAETGSTPLIELENNVNVNRGDMIVKASEIALQSKRIESDICWMDSEKLLPQNKYILQHGSRRVLAKIEQIEHIIKTDFSEKIEKQALELNDIGRVSLKLNQPIFADDFTQNKANGSFILIDPKSHTTAGIGFVRF
ncbi:MAG: sulfate adenylyltransferase subunit 1 [Flavobacteriales bacterium]